MKKIILTLLILLSISTGTRAQWFVTGSANIGYLKNNFQLAIKPGVGYEITDKWAVGLSAGMNMISSDVYADIEPYVRYNCWNNDKFFFDIKAKSDIIFDSYLESAQIGLSPSIRYKINKHWQVFGDVGLLGADYFDGDWSFAIGTGTIGINTGVIYKF